MMKDKREALPDPYAGHAEAMGKMYQVIQNLNAKLATAQATRDKLLEEIGEWKTATMLSKGGDPAPLTPADLEKVRTEDDNLIDKLPKTADGVPVVPGMKVYKRWIVDDSKVSGRIWAANDDREVEWIDEDGQIVFCDGDRHDIRNEEASDYYSTEAGAEKAAHAREAAAKEDQKEKIE